MNKKLVGAMLMLMLGLAGVLVWLVASPPHENRPLRIALSNWPGYDPLYLANQKGFLKREGLDIEFITLNSMTDMRVAFERGLLDGYTGTLMEVVESMATARMPGHVVLLTDYSNGGDMLLAQPEITGLEQLRGKTIGAEITASLGRYMLARMLQTANISASEVRIRNGAQDALAEHLARGEVAAILTYNPYAGRLKAEKNYNVLFSSADIPGEVVDIVAVSPDAMKKVPDISRRLQRAWQTAMDYAATHPSETMAIFSARYRMSPSDYDASLQGTKELSVMAMQNLVAQGRLANTVRTTVAVLAPSYTLSPQAISETLRVWVDEEVYK